VKVRNLLEDDAFELVAGTHIDTVIEGVCSGDLFK